ncbi:MAG: DUF2004 domain-containing protein [Chitinophagales bacterium]
MSKYKLPYFGEIENDSLKEYYCVDTKVDDKEIQIDINFTSEFTDNKNLETIKEFLSKIGEMDKRNIQEYRKDFQQGGETDDYIQFYIDALSEDELKELINTNEEDENQKRQLLEKLELKRVGLYPDETGYFGVFDYSIKLGDEFCNQLLVINTNEKGELDDITWES